jgi:hypothetical protein
MDHQSLESAIINEAEEAIRALALKEVEEIRKLDESYAAEISVFENNIRYLTDAKIAQESSKVENRAVLDLKKIRLRSTEMFINTVIEEAMETIRVNPNYKRYLLNSVMDAVSRIPVAAETARLKGPFSGNLP